jgi:hypothetical protein
LNVAAKRESQDYRLVETIEWKWQPDDGEPWLVGYHMADLDGVPTCVGVTVRSFLTMPVYGGSADYEEGGTVDAPPHRSWVPLPPSRDDFTDAYLRRSMSEREPLPKSLADGLLMTRLRSHEWKAMDVEAHTWLGAPRRLTATILKKLAFDSELRRARGEEARHVRREANTLRSFDAEKWDVTDDLFERVAATLDSRADSLELPSKRLGRPSRWTNDDLKKAATIYSAALLHGARPVKLVEEEFGLTDQPRAASKLIQRCRKMGLLGPTEPRKAGGGILRTKGER